MQCSYYTSITKVKQILNQAIDIFSYIATLGKYSTNCTASCNICCVAAVGHVPCFFLESCHFTYSFFFFKREKRYIHTFAHNVLTIWLVFNYFCVLLIFFKVHGLGTPAGRANLQANDAIIYVDNKDVTEMTHEQVVQLIKNHSGLELSLVIER